jgi:serine protease
MARFESIAFSVGPRGRRADTIARSVVAATVGSGWRVQRLAPDKGEFEAVPRRAIRATSAAHIARAWDRVYELRRDRRVVWAEPLFEMTTAEQHRLLPRAEVPDPRTGDFEWSLTHMRVQEAWDLFTKIAPGAGVIVGHPDTGYTKHPEIFSSRLLVKDGFDFEDGDADPTDPLPGGVLRNPSHGTGTSSVIMSARGKQPGTTGDGFVSGTALAAELVPIRTTKSVVLWSMHNLTSAIRYAIDQKAHVVSISLGGPYPSRALHSAVTDAVDAGIIVLCAAGNLVEFVVFPAAFEEVIAVAASTVDDKEWSGSCRGPAVDVTAPGAAIWRALTTKKRSGFVFDVERGDGTSFSVAATAGIAALWLSFHGRRVLLDKFGPSGLAPAFKEYLQRTCRVPPGWDTNNFGAGIVDARTLLEAKLPKTMGYSLRRTGRKLSPAHDDTFETIVYLAQPAPRSGVALVLARLFRVDEAMLRVELEHLGDELAFALADDPKLRIAFRATCIAATPPARRGRRYRPAAPPNVAGIRRRLVGPRASRQLAQTLRARR